MATDLEIAERLARLESAGASVGVVVATEPPSERAAVLAWVEARGWRRGTSPAPPAAVLALAYRQHAAAVGWARDSIHPTRLGTHLTALGWPRYHTGGRRGFKVDRETADALWALAPPGLPRIPPKRQRRARRTGRATRRVAFWPLGPKAKPLVDTLGRVWPHARAVRWAGIGCHVAVQRAALHGGGAAGCLWRFLAPHEVATVPHTARAGDVLPSLAWARTATGSSGADTDAHCPACGTHTRGGVDSPPHLGGTPPTPHSPGGGLDGSHRGGSPPHTF